MSHERAPGAVASGVERVHNTWRNRYTAEGLQRIAAVVGSEQPEVLAEFMRTRGIEAPDATPLVRY